jgi:hypothetical protein
MSHCPQCKREIGGGRTEAYAVGWCNQDIHFGPCLTLHIRSCPKCRPPNEAVIARQGQEGGLVSGSGRKVAL